jgi:DNA adenine methylase
MNSPLSYIGGKSKLSKIIISMIPDHKTYCEVFAGAGWVFFKKDPSKYEMLNDKDGDLIAFYRVLQNHLEEFLKQFKWLLSSHQWWDEWTRQQEAGGLTDIQRAARYYYIQRQSFGGKVAGRTWGASVEHAPRINLLRIEEDLSAVHIRLSRVIIENLDWLNFVKKCDRKTSFFYLDPPYYRAPVYQHNFYKLDDFLFMAKELKSIKGKFILSINDLPEMRNCFSFFNIRPVTVGYTTGKSRSIGKELIIKNF